MKKIGLVVSGVTVAIFIFSFAYAGDPKPVVGETSISNKPGGVGGAWKKPEVNAERTFEAVPPGIEKRGGDIPGKGKHLGWEQGQHKGWDKVESGEGTGVVKPDLDRRGVENFENFVSQIQNWLNERPKLGITEEGGVSGYRQAIKNWLDKKPEAPDDIIKEITPSS